MKSAKVEEFCLPWTIVLPSSEKNPNVMRVSTVEMGYGYEFYVVPNLMELWRLL